jgi:hypothetical protein
MNSLEKIISHLVDEVADYIRQNEDIQKLRNSELRAEASAKPVTTDHPGQETSEASSGDSATASSEVTAQSDTGTTASSEASTTSEAPGLFALFAYAAGKFVPGHNETKAEKTTEAERFISALKDLQRSLEKVYEPAQVKSKLDDLAALIDAEIRKIALIRVAHRKTEGKYDALLLVFKTVLDWLRQPENQELLCIALKSHEVKDLQKGAQIPSAKELIEFLMNTILDIQLDQARNANATLLDSYQRTIPEQAYDALMESLPDAIRSLDTFNNLYHSAPNQAQRVGDIDRLQNVRNVVGALCDSTIITRDNNTAFLANPFVNTYLDTLVNKLTAFKDDVVAKCRARKAEAISSAFDRDKNLPSRGSSTNVSSALPNTRPGYSAVVAANRYKTS